MKIVSYNIMFNDIKRTERLLLLINLLKVLQPDIICLQEVMNDAKNLIITQLNDYNCIDFDFNNLRRYKEIVLYKNRIYKPINYSSAVLPTTMGRVLNVVTFTENNKVFNIITFHLESLESPDYRKQQIAILNSTVKSLKIPTICCGDTNLKKGETDLPDFNKEFIDIWRYVGSPERGKITSHGDRFFGTDVKERYDRFWIRDFNVKSYTLLGRKPVNDLYISDHDGILCELF